jgi:hypothetical protein
VAAQLSEVVISAVSKQTLQLNSKSCRVTEKKTADFNLEKFATNGVISGSKFSTEVVKMYPKLLVERAYVPGQTDKLQFALCSTMVGVANLMLHPLGARVQGLLVMTALAFLLSGCSTS